MSEHKTAQLHSSAQDRRIKELSAELDQIRMTSQQLTALFQHAARQQVSTCRRRQLDAFNQQTMDMQKSADLQRQDVEREIGKLWKEQQEALLLIQSLGGTPGQTELRTTSAGLR